MIIILKEKLIIHYSDFLSKSEICLAYETFSNHSVHITCLSIIKNKTTKLNAKMCKQLEYIMISKGEKFLLNDQIIFTNLSKVLLHFPCHTGSQHSFT